MKEEKGTVLEPMREALLPCPFCGEAENIAESGDNGYGSFWVCCDACGATISERDMSNQAEANARWNRRLAAQQRAETPPERRQVAFDGSPEDTILRLRANLRAVTDAYEDLIEAATFPPKGRSADDKESRDNWWEDASLRIKAARQILEDSLC